MRASHDEETGVGQGRDDPSEKSALVLLTGYLGTFVLSCWYEPP